MKKPSVTFWLKKKTGENGDKPALIMLNFSYHSKRIKHSTGLSIKPSNWNIKSSLPKNGFADYSNYKNTLYEWETKVLGIYDDYISKGIIPEPASIKKLLNKKEDLKLEADVRNIHDYYKEFIDEKRLEVKELTLKKYNTLQNKLLNQYEEAYKCALCFESMDLLFEKKFKHFLTGTRKQDNNTVSKYMDCLKVFLKWAHKKGYHNNQYYLDFTSKRERTLVIYLELPEFRSLLNLNLSENSKLSRVRDWFCFQCLTGQRFSDIANLKWQDIVKDSEGKLWWHLFQIKGNKPEMVEIPIVAPAENILNNLIKEKNSPNVFQAISNQKFNEYIKDVCEQAGIKSHVNNVKYSGKKAISLSGPKYKFISSHTARKTFVTISHHYGNMTKEAIRAVTGHVNDKMLNVYLGKDIKYVMHEMHRTWSTI